MDKQTQTSVRNWLKKADEYLRAAEHEFNGEFYARSISTSYYAMFYAATAALESIGVERAKHSGVISAFGEHFVKTGKISGEFGRVFRLTMDDRERSEYDNLPVIDRDLAQTRLVDARRFVEAVTQHLTKHGLIME